MTLQIFVALLFTSASGRKVQEISVKSEGVTVKSVDKKAVADKTNYEANVLQSVLQQIPDDLLFQEIQRRKDRPGESRREVEILGDASTVTGHSFHSEMSAVEVHQHGQGTEGLHTLLASDADKESEITDSTNALLKIEKADNEDLDDEKLLNENSEGSEGQAVTTMKLTRTYSSGLANFTSQSGSSAPCEEPSPPQANKKCCTKHSDCTRGDSRETYCGTEPGVSPGGICIILCYHKDPTDLNMCLYGNDSADGDCPTSTKCTKSKWK